MAEYIEREALLKSLTLNACRVLIDGKIATDRLKGYSPAAVLNGYELGVKDSSVVIANTPAADVAPVVHGRWEVEIDFDEFWGDLDYYKCSVCGNRELRDAQTPYCPNCGAHMKDGE